MWDGQARRVDVQAVDAPPLAGMTMLEGHSLLINVVMGGAVVIAILPSEILQNS